MLQVTFWELLSFITICWIITRFIIAKIKGKVDFKRELKLLLVYGCIVVISRFVYFPMALQDGHLAPMVLDPQWRYHCRYNLKPFLFLKQIYPGYKMNVYGNIAMFVPVGIVWPFCFKKLNNVFKVTLAGFFYTFCIELSQVPFYRRSSDIDDIILNTTGVLIGAIIYFVVKAIRDRLFKGKKNDC
ncbi:MAG: VanZ family protein [Butyrivibrio sp.]|nr:VanZ family protein [Butyrivibrio sp.]